MPTMEEMLLDLEGRKLLLTLTNDGVLVEDFVEWEEGHLHAVARQWPTYGTDFVSVSSPRQYAPGNVADMLSYAAQHDLRLVSVQHVRKGWFGTTRKWYFVRPIRVTGMGPGVNGRITPFLEQDDGG